MKTDGEKWDGYVRRELKAGRTPGDEWGTPELWDEITEALLILPISDFVEIGQGTGKYTKRVIEANRPRMGVCCDVSGLFLAQVKKDIGFSYLGADMAYELIPGNPDGLKQAVVKHLNEGAVDLVFSIDSMVHVDPTILLSYFVNACSLLRKGGHLAMTVADGSSKLGVEKMAKDIPSFCETNGRHTGRFYFLTPGMLTEMLNYSGFTPEIVTCKGRDIWFRAIKK